MKQNRLLIVSGDRKYTDMVVSLAIDCKKTYRELIPSGIEFSEWTGRHGQYLETLRAGESIAVYGDFFLERILNLKEIG